jgi:hypothetical protein
VKRSDEQKAILDCHRAYERVEEDGEHDAITQSKAFAFLLTIKEAGALGEDDPRLAFNDPALALKLCSRLMRWFDARMEWIFLLCRKECPAAFDETATAKFRDAAEFGLIFGDKSEGTTDRLVEFINKKSELSQREWRMFLEMAGKVANENKSADWQHPELDTFLILMWPIVERFKWTYRDVLDAVQKKFPGRRGYPYDSTGNLNTHCSKVLGLHTANKPRTARLHPKGEAPLSELVQEISTEADLLRRRGFLAK